MTTGMRYWEDLRVDEVRRCGGYVLRAEEIAEFREYFALPSTILANGDVPKDADAVPGYMLCCVGMRMLVDYLLVDIASLGSPGVDRIDWPKPAFAGDVLSLETTLLSKRVLKSRPDMGLLKQRIVVCNQHGAAVAQMWSNALVARCEAET